MPLIVVGDDGSAGSRAAEQWAEQYRSDVGGQVELCAVDASDGSSAAHGLLDAAVGIMRAIHDTCAQTAEKYASPGDYVAGANIAGFLRVGRAMLALGLI